MLTYILLAIGFFLLIKGAHLLVEGATSIAKKFRISDIIVGLTIVAFGTSMPELVVNLVASFNGASEISIGNILGSNIANILLILGVTAVIRKVEVGEGTVWKEIPFSLFVATLLLVLSNGYIFGETNTGMLDKTDGLILLFFFSIFLVYTFFIAKSNQKTFEVTQNTKGFFQAFVEVLGGMFALYFGGRWVVNGAISIAEVFNISQTVIGVTIVALGTSLPELVTSVIATLKHKSDIAIGNIVGSNIFNILWVLGISSIILPIKLESETTIDFAVLILSSFLLFMFLFVGKDIKKFQPDTHALNKKEGLIFIAIYIIYIVYRVVG